jgi:hypothetical protein
VLSAARPLPSRGGTPSPVVGCACLEPQPGLLRAPLPAQAWNTQARFWPNEPIGFSALSPAVRSQSGCVRVLAQRTHYALREFRPNEASRVRDCRNEANAAACRCWQDEPTGRNGKSNPLRPILQNEAIRWPGAGATRLRHCANRTQGPRETGRSRPLSEAAITLTARGQNGTDHGTATLSPLVHPSFASATNLSSRRSEIASRRPAIRPW